MSPSETTALVVVDLPVGAVYPNPWNPNLQNEKVQQAERESIEHFGFIDPITVRPHPTKTDEFEIIDGEHRWSTVRDLGHELIPAIVLPLDDVAAKKLTVILNETRGDADVVLLGKLLADLQAETGDIDELLLGLPYSAVELDHLTALADVDWDQYTGAADLPPAEPGSGADGTDQLVSFLLRQDQVQAFQRFVDMCGHEWGTGDDMGATVFHAMQEAARNL